MENLSLHEITINSIEDHEWCYGQRQQIVSSAVADETIKNIFAEVIVRCRNICKSNIGSTSNHHSC